MIEIIIPTYNEIEQIEKTIDSFKVFKGDFRITFVDGGSQDGTDRKILEKGYRLLRGPSGRGSQLKYAVEDTKGDKILFLHSDSYFKENPLKKIDACLEDNKVGAFKLRFQPDNFYLKVIAFNSNNRIWLRNIAFGDQGIFIRRDFYHKIGGFKAISLMEDYDLSIRIKKSGERIKLLDHTIYTSPRRFEKNGYTRTILNMQRCQHLFRKRVDPDEIRKIYK